jgi:hypothetical protein
MTLSGNKIWSIITVAITTTATDKDDDMIDMMIEQVYDNNDWW